MPSTSEMPRIYLVRHGETAWSLSRQLTGRADIPLTEHGEQGARALAPMLRDVAVARVLVSPLRRARHTADLAGVGAHAEVDPDLTEWDYGEYQGKKHAEVDALRPGWDLFEHGCPGGESLSDIDARAKRVVDRIRASGENVLLVAHRDILRVVIARWLRLPPLEARTFYLDTSSVSVLGYHPTLDQPVVRKLNVTTDPLA